MKFSKYLTLILAACLLCGTLMACDKKDDENKESTTETVQNVTKLNVNLIVKADGEQKVDGTIECNGTLGDAIEKLTLLESDYTGNCFDETGILQNVCGIAAGDGKSWVAYYEDKGKVNGAIPSIKDHGPAAKEGELGLTDGCTIVLVLE